MSAVNDDKSDDIVRFFGHSSHCKPEVMTRIFNDIENLCNAFHFSCRAATWGAMQQRKLCVYGGLPIRIKSRKNPKKVSSVDDSSKEVEMCYYVLPLQLWLTQLYPIEPPLLYLFSTEQGCRIVSNHKYVDPTGRCHTPELSAWNPTSSSLSKVVEDLGNLLSSDGFCPLCIDREAVGSVPKGNTAIVSHELAHGGVNSAADKEIDGNDKCVVCFSPKDTVLVPCGHYCLCGACATNLPYCPLCREFVKFRQRVFA